MSKKITLEIVTLKLIDNIQSELLGTSKLIDDYWSKDAYKPIDDYQFNDEDQSKSLFTWKLIDDILFNWKIGSKEEKKCSNRNSCCKESNVCESIK